jgi:CheY-like chemotaxis protein
MVPLLSFVSNTPRSQPHETPERSFTQPRSLAGSPKTALLVEDVECLSSFLRRYLEEEGYAVRTACSTEEGLRLYRDFGPFNVVLINYHVPQRKGRQIDPLQPQTNGFELALAIQTLDSAQGIIVAANSFRNASEVPRPPQAMDIPVLVDLSIYQLRSLLEKIEVDRAINALTSADLLRLEQFAKSLIRILGRSARGDWEDLFGETVYRSLIGAGDPQNGRHWNRNVPFVQHLMGAMKSIANMWKRQFRDKHTYLVSQLRLRDSEGQDHSLLDCSSSQVPVDQRLIEKAEEDRILAMFEDDPEATLVLRGWMDGLRKSEIMAKGGLVGRAYVATVKRIQRKLAED